MNSRVNTNRSTQSKKKNRETVSYVKHISSSTVTKIQVLDTQNRIMTEETFAPFTFITAQDELTLSVKIQVPQQR